MGKAEIGSAMSEDILHLTLRIEIPYGDAILEEL
jgi:hypothetical protein